MPSATPAELQASSQLCKRYVEAEAVMMDAPHVHDVPLLREVLSASSSPVTL